MTHPSDIYELIRFNFLRREPPFFGVCPKKVFLFWSLPSRNTQEYDEADDEEDSPHQGQRGDLVQAGEVLKKIF